MTWDNLKHVLFLLIVLVLMAPSLKSQVTVPAELTLRQAKDILVANSPLLQAEKMNQGIARGVFIDVSKRPNLELSVSAAGLGSQPGTGTFLGNQEFSTTLSYDVQTQGKRQKSTQLARYSIEVAEFEFQDRVRLLSWELKQRDYQVVLGQREAEVTRKISAEFNQFVTLTRTRYQNGDISGRELRRIETEQYRLQENVIEADLQLENAQDRLLALLGTDVLDTNFHAVDDFSPAFTPAPLVELKQDFLQFRKDLEAQQKRIDQARTRMALEKARSVPDLKFFGGYRRDFGHNGAIIGVSVPLFLFNKNQGNIARAEVRHEQESLTLKALKIQVSEEIQLALNQLDSNRRRLQVFSSVYLENTRQARDISETAYRLGSVSLLEFLDAERTYGEAVRRYNRALYELQVSWAQLEFTVGRDLP